MLDWFTGQVLGDARSLKLDCMYHVTAAGDLKYTVEQWRTERGTFDAAIRLRRSTPHKDLCSPYPSVFEYSGNPLKFAQGHNVFGPPASAEPELLRYLCQHLPPEMRFDPGIPVVHASRRDLTTAVDLGSPTAVHDWLQAAAALTRSRHGRPLQSNTTLYWGKHSRRWSLKAYSKADELLVHPIPDPRAQELLRNYCASQLRLELTLRGQELGKHANTLSEDLIWQYAARIERFNIMTTGKGANSLPVSSRQVYRAWLRGDDVTHDYKARQFYEHRRRILDATGDDISLEPHAEIPAATTGAMDLTYLKKREVSTVPYVLREWLFDPSRYWDN